jgi:hypothetical protein
VFKKKEETFGRKSVKDKQKKGEKVKKKKVDMGMHFFVVCIFSYLYILFTASVVIILKFTQLPKSLMSLISHSSSRILGEQVS